MFIIIDFYFFGSFIDYNLLLVVNNFNIVLGENWFSEIFFKIGRIF